MPNCLIKNSSSQSFYVTPISSLAVEKYNGHILVHSLVNFGTCINIEIFEEEENEKERE